jgi:hypothetical protein
MDAKHAISLLYIAMPLQDGFGLVAAALAVETTPLPG